MLEAILLGIIGIPIVAVCLGICTLCTIAILDAVGEYAGNRRAEKLIGSWDKLHGRK